MKTDPSASPTVDTKRRAAIEALLDHALEETFPASDPTAVSVEAPSAKNTPGNKTAPKPAD